MSLVCFLAPTYLSLNVIPVYRADCWLQTLGTLGAVVFVCVCVRESSHDKHEFNL